MNGEVAADMEAAVDRFEDDPDVWVGVITATLVGDRPVFSAGADLKAVNTAAGAGISTQKGGFAGFAYRERTKPVIAAVDGLATAGGCEIVLACDLVVGIDAIVVRTCGGQAQPRRRRGRAVPPAACDRQGGGDGGHPHRRAVVARACARSSVR